MKPNIKRNPRIRTIEDIALEFLRHNKCKRDFLIESVNTLVDSNYNLKNPYFKNSNNLLILDESNKIIVDNKSSLSKNITLYKLPQKYIEDDDSFSTLSFENQDGNLELIQKNETNKNPLRNLKKLKYNKKLYFPIDYEVALDGIREIYYPLKKNMNSITSVKASSNNTLELISHFFDNDSVFEINVKEPKNLNISNEIKEYLDEEKILELGLFGLLVFILEIVFDIKIESLEIFKDEEIIKIYRETYNILDQLFNNLLLQILYNNKIQKQKKNINDESQTESELSSFESLCMKYVNECIKNKLNLSPEQILKCINENHLNIKETLSSAITTIMKTLVCYKLNVKVYDYESEFEKHFDFNEMTYKKLNINNNSQENEFNESDLSKEFLDQYRCFKILHIFLSLLENPMINTSLNENNNIINILSNINEAFKEIQENIYVYYSNFKLQEEKTKVKIPFLPEIDIKRFKYTLVLDLDETLVHYVEEDNKAFVQVRPYADNFLQEMGKCFEIVIFTAAAEDYADIVLNELDKNNIISFKLYRRHTDPLNGVFFKDLSKLGRDLSKVIIVDNNKDNFNLQPDNGIQISDFLGDQNDSELLELSENLKKIYDSKPNDVRPLVKKLNSDMQEKYKNLLKKSE